MNQKKIFVHRANFVQEGGDPVDQIDDFYRLGFRNLEIDLTLTGTDSYKFCHPSMLKSTPTEYTFSSPLFKQLAAEHNDVLWLIDIKYLDENSPPVRLIETISITLGAKAIFSAALPQLLTAIHKAGVQTAQFFRPDFKADLSFAPDYFILKSTDVLDKPLDRTILHCSSLGEAEHYTAQGAGYGMVDGETLLAPGG
jgi:hypothetical protein